MQKHRTQTIPTFERTLSTVDPLSNLVYQGLEKATLRTRAFFNAEKHPHDPFLAPCLMRFFTKHTLRDSGVQAEEDGDFSDFEGLPNNGLAFFYKGHHTRILKAATIKGTPWKLPGCGVSEPRTAFYNQQLGFYVDAKNGMHSAVLNIIYLWDFDQRFSLAGVYLACPMMAAPYAKDVLTHWCEALPHPALARAGERPPVVDGAQADFELEELLRPQEDDDEAINRA